MEKVSVIIPIYNSENYLVRCLDSVLSQSYSNYEVVCIDDCSRDKSAEILMAYKKKYGDKIKILNNVKNVGQGISRMRGISVSTGEYIFFVDSDDYIDKSYLDNYMSQVVGEEYDVVVGGFTQDKNGVLKEHHIEPSKWSIISFAHACCKMYRKRFIIENNIDFGNYRKGEDIYFSLMLVLQNARHKFIDYCGYYYYKNEASTTNSLNWKGEFECVVSQMFSELMKKIDGNDIQIKKYIEYAYMAGMINAILTYGHGCGWENMKKKYYFFVNDLNEKFPNMLKNKMLYKLNLKGPTIKCKIGVAITALLLKLHICKFMFIVVSFI